ncbi:MAG: hypothetical protein KKA67_13215 [Spirochaetes bacterium]|nr:hypothetical protein [Spirochaetota bacterium]MBU1081366.1 hypothetical protein [Spirochaetota bacterium]
MPHVIHYEDDFFIVDGLVRVVCDAARLEPDADIIGDAVISAARLADATLRRVKDVILQNEHLVDRAECLRLLARTTRAFADALSDLARPGSPLEQTFASSSDELERVAAAHRAAAAELRDVLHATSGGDDSPEDHVSGDELSELLRA